MRWFRRKEEPPPPAPAPPPTPTTKPRPSRSPAVPGEVFTFRARWRDMDVGELRRGGEVGGRGYDLYPSDVGLLQQRGGYVTKVSGVTHQAQALQSPAFEAGSRLALVPEPDNPYGPAVSVWDKDRTTMVGYVPKDLAAEIGEGLAAGKLHREAFCAWEWLNDAGERIGLRIIIAPGPAEWKERRSRKAGP